MTEEKPGSQSIMSIASEFETSIDRKLVEGSAGFSSSTTGTRTLAAHAVLHVLCAGWLGLALGGLDAFWVADHSGPVLRVVRTVLAGAGSGATLGVLFGALIALLGVLLTLLATFAARNRAIRALGRTRLTMARVLAFSVGGALALSGFVYVLRLSDKIVVLSLRSIVLTIGAALSIGVALFASHWLAPLFSRWLRTRQRLMGLGSSRWVGIHFAVLIAVPTLVASVVLVETLGPRLGTLRRLLLVATFVVLERAAFLLLRPFPVRKLARVASSIVLLALLVAGVSVPRPGGLATRSLSQARLLPDTLHLLERLTDFDRDGFSAFFGGRDCAGFDHSRFPGAREVPGNGVDEDCDGADAVTAPVPAVVVPKFSGQSRHPLSGQPFNVLWYIVDSLRPDHLKTYGYAFDTSPMLTGLSGEAWVFEHAYSQSSATALSVPSMFSGRNPGAMHWTRGTFPVADANEFYLSRAFAARGYLSGLVINTYSKEYLPGIQHGFERVLVTPAEVNWRSGDYLVSSVFQLVAEARSARKPFFLVAHVDDVHHPYLAAEGKSVPSFPSPGERARYDAGIALFDQGIRVVVEHLRHSGLWERTVLIVTADHGEEFGEHGGTTHSRTCYAEVARVPLLIRIPRAGAQRVSQRIALIDLAPTLLELLDARSTPAALDGQSLLIPIYEPAVTAPERPVFCAIYQLMPERESLFIRSVRRGRWSFFEDVKAGRAELYDGTTDPGELRNLAGSPDHTAIVSDLRRLMSGVKEGNLFRVAEGLE